MAEANVTRVSSSVIPVQDIDQTAGGQTYSISELDKVAGKTFGGKYNTLTAYGSEAIAAYISSVVAENGITDGLDSSGWQKGAAGPTRGTLPTTVYAIAVEYVSELGTVGNVSISIKQTGETELKLANLDLGEGQVIPISAGLTLAEVLIGADAYTSGTNEATVNVLVIGV